MASCVQRLIAHFGGNMSLAGRMCGQSRQQMLAWKRREYIPTNHASVVETATGGAITKLEILEETEYRKKMRRLKREGDRKAA